MAETILVVDDDPVQRRLISAQVEKLGYATVLAESGEDALARLEAETVDAVLLDLMLPDLDGIGVLQAMAKKGLRCPVIMLTAKGSVDTAIAAMRAGAFDFLVKPAQPKRIADALAQALAVGRIGGAEPGKDHPARKRKHPKGLTMIARSSAMQRVLDLAERAARSTIPVLIQGESGTGKEVLADMIRTLGDRANRPFVPVNCGAIPSTLVESVLFGHEKGAFTDATEARSGKFGEADGGTLFLDEVGDLPLDAQVKLLRAVQSGEVDPVGARKPKQVDVRLITATHRDLDAMVRAATFRDDLFYRLNIFPITLPPLRERTADILPLARHFAEKHAAMAGRTSAPDLTPAASDMLLAFDWPGNIRQLENAVMRAMVATDRSVLDAPDFSHIAIQMEKFDAPRLAPAADDLERVPQADPASVPILDETGALRALSDIERDVIANALDRYDGQMSKAARDLGIGRSTLYRKVAEYGLTTETGDAAA